MLGRVRSAVFEPALLITKLNWYPCKRWHSRWKLSQELKWKIISFLPDYTHAKMAERERYKREPRISVPFMLELEYESKIIKKLLVIKEICSWLPLGLDGRKVCSQNICDCNVDCNALPVTPRLPTYCCNIMEQMQECLLTLLWGTSIYLHFCGNY